jgi:hypothetical protein
MIVLDEQSRVVMDMRLVACGLDDFIMKYWCVKLSIEREYSWHNQAISGGRR